MTGLVENPRDFTFAELTAMPKHEQITQHHCIQGWSGIAKWGGVRMSDVLDAVRPPPSAQWVVFRSFAEGSEPGAAAITTATGSTICGASTALLAYEMNGEPLPEVHGAPLRLRNEVELGFKQVKWIESIEFVESFAGIGKATAVTTKTTNISATACRSKRCPRSRPDRRRHRTRVTLG